MGQLKAIRTLVLLALTLPAYGAATTQEAAEDKADRLAVAEAIAPSVVRVEYTLQYDKGEPPQLGFHSEGPMFYRAFPDYQGGETLVTEERPMETAGYVLSPTTIVSRDITLHPRFIKEIKVRYGDKAVAAKPSAYAQKEDALFLELSEPLEGIRPLEFDANAQPPYLSVIYGIDNAEWFISVDKLSSLPVGITEPHRKFAAPPPFGLVTDSKGVPVGLSMQDEWPPDDSWKGSPEKWPTISAEAMDRRLRELEERAGQGVLRVSLSFRSPMKRAGESAGFNTPRRYYMRYRGDEEEDEDVTERNVLGLLIPGDRVLVLANLKSSSTARLERITVCPPSGESVAAKFVGTLADYGAFVAALEKPLPGSLVLAEGNVLDYRDKLLMLADIKVQGEKRVAYHDHARIRSFQLGWKRRVYPELEGGNLFFFTGKGELLLFPIQRRKKVESDRYMYVGSWLAHPAAYIKEVIDNLAKNTDPSNIPLPEEQENRLAWLGVELQPLDRELARTNNVSDLTRDGEIGAMVSYVYPDSPAAKAGIEPGFILLRLYVQGQPKPMDVRLEDYGFRGESFPWEEMDRMPEQMLERMPAPWPSAENSFARSLTELGFGKKFRAEFYANGKVITRDFEVVESPAHFDSALRYKSDVLGLTVRDLTYEVRRFFQRSPQEPGVIVSKVEPGGKAAVSKIMPYEIITHVNDQPVAGVKEFEKLTSDQVELRLSVKRMTRGRVVKIKLAPTTQKAVTTQPRPATRSAVTSAAAASGPAE